MNKNFFHADNLTNYNKDDDFWYDEEELISLSDYPTCNYFNQFCKHFLYGYCFKEDYDSCPHSK